MALVIGHDERLYDAGIELYRLRPDKDWSLTDCISFVVMAKRGISAALPADRHFEQAGFTALLKP
jgi:predicted nucleic acid-binding protein